MSPFRAVRLTLALALLACLAPLPARAAGGLPVERWRAYMERTHVPGLAVAVVSDTGIVAMATLGLRDVERGLPVTPRTRFYIASCTKTLTAAAVWSLASEGALDLDAPVRRYYPAFRLSSPGLTDSLSLRDLLTHRQGLTCPPISFGTAQSGQMTDTTFDRLLGSARIRGKFSYSNLHYQIAARALAEQLRRPWQQVVDERVLTPAGMARTTARASVMYADPDVALPHVFRDGRLSLGRTKTDRTMHAAGGHGGSLEDMTRWLRLQLADGRIDGRQVFPAGMMRGMQAHAVDLAEPHPLRGDWKRIGWTAGWEERELAGDRMLVHTGQYLGYAAHLSFMPERGIGVVVLANGEAPPLTEQIGGDAYDWALGREGRDDGEKLASIMARFAPARAADSSHGGISRRARRYTGTFANADWGTLEVTAKGSALAMRYGDLPLPLTYAGVDRFVADGDTPGQFEIVDGGRVGAVWLRMGRADSVRFVRK